jgi:hypothetical protein
MWLSNLDDYSKEMRVTEEGSTVRLRSSTKGPTPCGIVSDGRGLNGQVAQQLALRLVQSIDFAHFECCRVRHRTLDAREARSRLCLDRHTSSKSAL